MQEAAGPLARMAAISIPQTMSPTVNSNLELLSSLSGALVDDEGEILKKGTPTGDLPHVQYRMRNYQLVMGGKYGMSADRV